MVLKQSKVRSGLFTSSPTQPMTWETANDWDNALSESRVVHEDFGDHNSGVVELGYPSSDVGGSNLEFYLPFDENSGSSASDVTGNGYSATHNSGASAGASGILNTDSALYDGTNRGTDLDQNVPALSSYTLSCWFYSASTDASDLFNLVTNNSVIVRANSRATTSNPGTLDFVQYDSGGSFSFSSASHNNNEWVHFVGVWDGSSITPYINGSSGSSASISSMDSLGESSDTIGYLLDTTELGTEPKFVLDGRIDEPRLYDRALSASEVQELYDTGQSGDIETFSQTFAEAKEPSLRNLSYELNGGDIEVQVTGSPGSGGSSEQKTVFLDGANVYPLDWSSSHSEFEVIADLTTPDIESSPRINRIELF